jgi:hypothetical protein
MPEERYSSPDSTASARRLERIQRLSRLLDSRFGIPGTNVRFGLDGLIGLIPGIGDVLTNSVSGYIILEAARAGASKGALIKMTINVIIDFVVGMIPILGDLFDVAFKANLRNIKVLEDDLKRQGTTVPAQPVR